MLGSMFCNILNISLTIVIIWKLYLVEKLSGVTTIEIMKNCIQVNTSNGTIYMVVFNGRYNIYETVPSVFMLFQGLSA